MADVVVVQNQVGLDCSDPLSGHLVAEYAYDGQGGLVKRTMADGSWTVYVGGIYEEHSDETYVKYYSAFGRRIAMRDSAGMVHYILSDHLGSSTVVTDSTGETAGTMKYYPYGAERSATGRLMETPTEAPITDKLFTGQQREPEGVSALALYNYGARFYSTLTGRFVSPDPLIATPGDPQMLNRYAYARNNPLRLVDPTGLSPNDCGDGTKPCPEPAPTPVPPVPTPPPGVNEAEWRAAVQACVANPVACYKWAYGSNPHGLVVVMGVGQSHDSIESFSGYGKEFLEQYEGCANRAGQCWDAAKDLMKQAGAGAVYEVFGIMLIETAPGAGGGWFSTVLGLGEAAFDVVFDLDSGQEALRNVLRQPTKDMTGVMGFSLGAYAVTSYYENHQGELTPFFLVEPVVADPGALSLPTYHGTFHFGTDEGFLNHGTHDEQADYVLFCLTTSGGCK